MTVNKDLSSGYTRRTVLRRAGAGALTLGGGSAFLAACGGSSSGGGSGGGGHASSLAAWWWGDPAAMPKWLNDSAAKFKAQRNVSINITQQQTETLISAFTAAAAAKQGPDIAAQWATQPVLAQAWADAVTPLDDYVSAAERAHWRFTEENLYGGKLWAAPMYAVGAPFCLNKKLFEKAGLDPTNPPATWDEFTTTCQTLKSKGITPLALGNKDTFGGRWAFAFNAIQTLDALDDLKAPLLGDASFGDEKYSLWMTRFKELVDAGFYNDDAMSLDSLGGANVFKAGNAAMAWDIETDVINWGTALGSENVIPFPYPKFADGKLADSYTGTQSTSYFITKWAADPKTAGEFLTFLHQPAQLTSFYKLCGVLPADDRFDAAVITDPLRKALAARASTGTQVWLENWIPPQLDETANGPGGQKLMTGGSVKDVAALWDQQAKAWREQSPDIAARFKKWQMTPVSV
jgi:raffinose/stachyose/melibiose transport system substrate-binding protein